MSSYSGCNHCAGKFYPHSPNATKTAASHHARNLRKELIRHWKGGKILHMEPITGVGGVARMFPPEEENWVMEEISF